jgi:hypothetical protein
MISTLDFYCTLVLRRKQKLGYGAAGLKEFYFRHFGNAWTLCVIPHFPASENNFPR